MIEPILDNGQGPCEMGNAASQGNSSSENSSYSEKPEVVMRVTAYEINYLRGIGAWAVFE